MDTNIRQFLEDNAGGFSATRLAFLLWTICVLGAWLFISVSERKFQPITPDVVTILGILTTGKVVQRYSENTPADKKSPQSPVEPKQ